MSTPRPVTPSSSGRPAEGERSGCATALYVLFGLGLLLLVVAGASVYFFVNSEEGQRLVETAKRGLELVAVASSAPGTEELRAAGCEVAMVDSADAVIDIVLPLLPDEEAQQEMLAELEAQVGRDLEGLVLVFCSLPQLAASGPSCRELARVYGEAVEFPPAEFAVIVAQQGASAPTCSGLYTESGELIQAFDPE